MSQVIVEKDRYGTLRAKTREQELKIDDASFCKHWQNQSSGLIPLLEKGIGIAALPVLFFWGLLAATLGACLAGCLVLFRLMAPLGALFRSR